MGLYVVYGILKEYGGDIQVTSELGRGTTFDVYLPLIKKEPLPDIDASEMRVAPGAGRILLVDSDMAEALRKVLETVGQPSDTQASN